ncbi:MAG: N,N-diacetylchitobiose transport system permease protein [Microbacteriaceae bacterium]|jgi:N,N'-diacetylchitobiose transport system permease protein|nr:N,N-diacetylchitobiose transport system permease protein [Microbacteriaceae bacterium]
MSVNASKTKVAFSLGAGVVAALSQRPHRRAGRRRTWIAPLVLLAPTAIVLILVVGYPLLQLVINSFQDFGLRALFTGQTAWIGFANYTGIFADPLFWPVLLRTFGFTASLVIGSVVIGMFFSELLVRLGTMMRTIFSFVMIIAWALPTVASTLVWQWQFQPLYGVLNWVITQIGWFGNFTSHSWTSTPGEAFLIVWLLIVWQAVPFVAFSLYAGQSQIPEECYEAAMLDGAGLWQIYRSVTLPFLTPVLYLVTILSIIWDFNVFNQLWILTQGGPSGGTTTLGIWSFQKAFASNSFGQGSAIAIVTTIILMVVTSFYIRRLIRSGEGL